MSDLSLRYIITLLLRKVNPFAKFFAKIFRGSSRSCGVGQLEHECNSCSRAVSEFNSETTQANECNSFANAPLFHEDPQNFLLLRRPRDSLQQVA